MLKSLKRIRLLLIFQTCFDGTSVIVSVTVKMAVLVNQVKLNESMYIKWENPDLNQQVKHINLTLSLYAPRPSFVYGQVLYFTAKFFIIVCIEILGTNTCYPNVM